MPRIQCHFLDCKFLEDGLCGAAAVVFEPEAGCLTYRTSSIILRAEGWDLEEEIEEDAWEDFGFEEGEWVDEEF